MVKLCQHLLQEYGEGRIKENDRRAEFIYDVFDTL
jgi:hypothetical protein